MCERENENIAQAVQKKRRIIGTAMRREPADLVLKNASYVNVFVKRHAKCNFVRNSDFPSIPCASKRSYQFLLRTQNVTFAGKTEYCGHKENRLKTPQALLNQGLRGF